MNCTSSAYLNETLRSPHLGAAHLPVPGQKERRNPSSVVDLQLEPGSRAPEVGEGSSDPYKQNSIVYYDTKPPTHVQQGVMFHTKIRKGRKISLIKIRFNKETRNVSHARDCMWDRYGRHTFYTCEQRSSIRGMRLWSKKKKKVRFAE